jgi:hypothetical protein
METLPELGLIDISQRHQSSDSATIVFVHGFNGSPRGTWTYSKTHAFWPEWLNEIEGLESAKIMSFGYQANWNELNKKEIVIDIADIAKQLKNGMYLHYNQHGDVRILVPTTN